VESPNSRWPLSRERPIGAIWIAVEWCHISEFFGANNPTLRHRTATFRRGQA
jgi:hypothetical protein